jgi:dTDP-4-amino-4,6-dideoxygalactose transaminase
VARYVRLGYNYRLSDVLAAIGRVQLGRLDDLVAERERIARRYDRELASLAGLRRPPFPEVGRHSWQSYVVVVEPDAPVEPGAFMARLAELGVSTRVGTYAVHREPYFVERFGPLDLPVSDEAARRSVALPIWNGLLEDSVSTVVAAIREAWKESTSTR